MLKDQTQASGALVLGEKRVGRTANLKAKAIDQAKKVFYISLYLWVFFAVLSLHKTAVLAHHHVDYAEQSFALINALVLAKVMLVADDLHLGSRFKDRPLIYSVLWSSLVFSMILIGFHIVEHGAIALLHGRPFADGLTDLGAGNVRGVITFAAIGFVALIPFFALRDLARVLGSDALWQLVFAGGQKTFTLVHEPSRAGGDKPEDAGA